MSQPPNDRRGVAGFGAALTPPAQPAPATQPEGAPKRRRPTGDGGFQDRQGKTRARAKKDRGQIQVFPRLSLMEAIDLIVAEDRHKSRAAYVLSVLEREAMHRENEILRRRARG